MTTHSVFLPADGGPGDERGGGASGGGRPRQHVGALAVRNCVLLTRRGWCISGQSGDAGFAIFCVLNAARCRIERSGNDRESAFRASRLSGTRSIEVALAEIEMIEHNVYVQRKERRLKEDEITQCSCVPPTGEGEMGCLDGCLNRVALIECIQGYCNCGERCDNMRIQRGTMPATQLFDCGRKGLGLKLLENIKAGSFVAEYMGEIVTEQEYYMRRVLYHNEKHRYMMVLSGGEVIDATRMGGRARFINHSCDPNCGVEKWDVNGEERCGIFALRDIFAGEELTFDYKFESFSKAEITECLCGAPNCRKVIGMNNRVLKKPNTYKKALVSAPADKEPKSLDPIVGRTQRPVQGSKKAEALMQRMARQRLLSNNDIRILRRSHVMLERNLTWHMEDDFAHLALIPYFISKSSAKHTQELKCVPDFFNWRDLPGFPKKMRRLTRKAKVARLHEVVESLQVRQQQQTNYLAEDGTSPVNSA